MTVPRIGFYSGILLPVIIALLLIPAASPAQEYKVFTSEEYGFTMKYPATWVKTEPKGNYYVVFQAPDLSDGFRNRIHVAAHKPVKDPISVFLQELRNGITDLQKKAGGKERQEVRIIDEGEFKSEVPGAYYFFIQAYENKLKIWMDIVIVFYKQDQTLLRISCLAPSQSMEKFQKMFNDVLVSVKFTGEEKPATPPAGRPQVVPAPTPGTPQPQVQPTLPPSVMPQPQTPPAQRPPATPQVRPSLPAPAPEPEEDEAEVEQEQPTRQIQPAPAPRQVPRGPLREPEKPATGIIN